MRKMLARFKEIGREIKNIKIKDYLKFLIIFGSLFIGFVAFDQISKYVAVGNLTLNGQEVTFIPNFIEFKLVYNKGAAWGMGDDALWSRILLCSISWIVFIYIPCYVIYAMAKNKHFSGLFTTCLGLILAGDFGNLIDRTFFFDRGVIDFISIQSWFPGFGIFNIADACLVVGLILLIIYFIVEEIQEQKAQKAKNEADLAKAKALDEADKAKSTDDIKKEENSNLHDEN